MQLLDTIHKSIYSPSFYRELAGKPIGFSVRYFLVLSLSLALFLTIVLSIEAVPRMYRFVVEVGPAFVKNYPEDLVVAIKNGRAEMNARTPAAIPFPQNAAPLFSQRGEAFPGNLAVVDTGSPFSGVEQFGAYDTFALLTSDALVYGTGDHLSVQRLRRVPDLVIDKKSVQNFFDNLESSLHFLPFFVVFGIFFMMFGGFAVRLIYCLALAVGILAIARLKKVSVDYVRSYQIGLHAMTLGLITHTFIFTFSPRPAIPFLFTALTLLVAWKNLVPLPVSTPTPPHLTSS